MHALRTDLADGYIARYEGGAFHIGAEGFGFTNEIRFDAREEFLYVVETTGGHVSRLRVDAHGNLGGREVSDPPAWAWEHGLTASPSTASAICGAPWSTPTNSSFSRRKET
jgi:gluconolactonase